MKSSFNIVFTDDIDSKFGGYAKFPNLLQKYIGKKVEILIRPKYRNDIGLLKHELMHVEQFNKYLFYCIHYNLSQAFRYKMELEAYNEQIKEYQYKNVTQAQWIIDALAIKYNLDIKSDDVLKDVSNLITRS